MKKVLVVKGNMGFQIFWDARANDWLTEEEMKALREEEKIPTEINNNDLDLLRNSE